MSNSPPCCRAWIGLGKSCSSMTARTTAVRRTLKELATRDERVKVVRFRRNYGQTAAMQAGIQHATGDVIVTLDGDLQNDPLDIPMMVAKLDEGYDLVHGWRKQRHDTLITRKLPSLDRQLADFEDDRLSDSRSGLHAQGDPPRNRPGTGTLRRNAPLHSDPGPSARGAVRGSRHAASSAAFWPDEIRLVADRARPARPDHRQVHARLFRQPDEAVRPLRPGVLLAGDARRCGIGRDETRRWHRHDGQSADALGILGSIAAIQFFSLGLLGEVNARIYYANQTKQNYAIRELINCQPGGMPAGETRPAIHRRAA